MRPRKINIQYNSPQQKYKRMRSDKKIQSILSGLLLGAGLLFFGQAAQVQAAAALSCLPETPVTLVDGVGTFTLVSGDAVVFTCEAKGVSGEVAALVLGKLTDVKGVASASSSDVLLVGDALMSTTLSFPAVFQSGDYRYTFTLFDKATSQPLTEEAVLLGVIKGAKRASIATVTFDREQYEWQDPFALAVGLDIPEGQDLNADKLMLHVTLADASGNDCVTLGDNVPVTSAQETLRLKFPVTGSCSNLVLLSLRASDGAILDQEFLAVGLSEATAAAQAAPAEESESVLASIPSLLLVFLGITGALLLVLVGYFFLRKSR